VPQYYYRARDWQGKKQEGYHFANSIKEVVEYLHNQNFVILNVKEVKQKTKALGESSLVGMLIPQKKPTAKELMVFCRQFATMIRAGITVLHSLEILAEQAENKHFGKRLSAIVLDLEKGYDLAGAMAQHRDFLPRIMLNMVEVGEAGGILDIVLNRLADHFEKQHDLEQKIKSATIYPAVISFVAIAVVFFMITFVVPTFADIFMVIGVEMPFLTRFLLVLGDRLLHFWCLLLGGALVVVLSFWRYVKTDKGRFQFDSLRLRLPLVGSFYQKALMARFSRTFSILIASGVDIITSLDLVSRVINNARIAQVINQARDSVSQGQTLSESLRAERLFPPMLIAMIASGEETGALDELLSKSADLYEAEVSYALERLSSVIEPVLIIVIGVFVALIVISLVMPMFEFYQIV
jgi:type IV pilus assembly protein PilC